MTYGEDPRPSTGPVSIAPIAASTPPPPFDANDRANATPSLWIGIGIGALVVLTILGGVAGRHSKHVAATRAAATAAPPPRAATALPPAATAATEAPLSFELDEPTASTDPPSISANKLPDAVVPGPATSDTTIHGNVAVPANPY